MTDVKPELRIVEFREDLAQAFHDINAGWIEAMFVMEATDRKVLENPREMIIDRDGLILFVEAADLGIVGAVALMKTSEGVYELTKMGVLESARGRKAGEFLLAACIDRARTMDMTSLYLLTNHICAAAIHLYEKAGFRHDAEIMEQYGKTYDRCNVAMEFPL
jgi:N-acetylglutamate synthase-like GNAT family acetyltransferase